MEKLKILSNKVLILPDEAKSLSDGGILLASREEVVQRGTVVSVGPGLVSSEGILIPIQVAEGDKVIFDHNRSSKVEIDGVKYYITFDTEILAVIQ